MGYSSTHLEAENAVYANLSQFCVGGIGVQLQGDFPGDVRLSGELQPFRLEVDQPDIRITVERVQRLPPSSSIPLFDSGTTWELRLERNQLQFDFKAALFGDRPFKKLVTDERFRQAVLQLSEECSTELRKPIEPLGYPVDELLIMHRLTQERAIELHGVGVVGPDGASNLFVGHSGAGKSTTARLWTSLHKVDILSDDRIIVRESPARELQPGDDPRQIFMYGTPWHGEGCFALPQRAPLKRVFILEHGHGNVLTRLTRSQMVGELFARAFVPFHRHEYVENALSFLEQVADSIPCYRYSFEPDERAVEKVLQLND
jgi:energy-coupling factor transporter ATP-binding protein EcfA2